MNEEKISGFYQLMLRSIEAQTVGGREGHFAVKFTGLVSMDVMTRWSKAQSIYLYEILDFNGSDQEELSFDQLEQNLLKRGVNLSQEELTILFDSLQIEGEGGLSRLDRYANGHLFQLSPRSSEVRDVLNKVALGLGADVSEDDL